MAITALPAAASAATKPTVTTRGATGISQSAATVHATVNPQGAQTMYWFQIGPTRKYGAQTTPASAGAGTKAVRVAGAVASLAPATTYHYRVVASNAKGVVSGGDRTFRTKPQPLGVSLAGTPNPVAIGGSTTLAGTLTGTGNAGRQVVLQSNPWPYTQGFLNAANPQVTDANGNFAFPVLAVNVNTQYRVLMPQKPEVVSPIVVEGTTVKVTVHWRVRRHARSGRVTLFGSILPAVDGTQVVIQKLVGGSWKDIRSTFARHKNAARSVYTKSFWQRHGGRYRVWHVAPPPEAHVSSASRAVHIRHTRR